MIGRISGRRMLFVLAVIAATVNAFGQSAGSSGAASNALALLSSGDQAGAEKLVSAALSDTPTDQQLTFYTAALLRSRFLVREADTAFLQTASLGSSSLYGRVSMLVVALDQGDDVSSKFTELHSIVEQNGTDLMLRWLLAMECRTFAYDRGTSLNARAEYFHTGVEQFRQILGQWSPGPVLVHQTFANLLDDLGLHGEALPHRYLAVQQEPRDWSFQGLWLTLYSMERYQEARVSIERAIQYAPANASYQQDLALTTARLTTDHP